MLPGHCAAAGLLIRSTDGLVLLVKTLNRSTLILPGGIVEADEPPAAAAEREVREELGLTTKAGQLLVVEHQPPQQGRRPSLLQFVFAAVERLDSRTPMRLQTDEIEAVSWLTEPQAIDQHAPIARRRAVAMFAAERDGRTRYLDADHVTCP